MKRITAEWLEKAEGDFKVAQREMCTPDPVYNVVCFLCQQCAEKYLKACLEEHDIPFEKTHDLVMLLDLGTGKIRELEAMKPGLAYLSPLAITSRYPGIQTDRRTAEKAYDIAQQIRAVIRVKLRLA